MTKQKKKKGRRGKYFTNVQPRLIEIEGWCREGLIDEQIWPRLSISKTSFYDYQNQHSEFSDALKKGKEIVDYQVENALLESASGHVKELRRPFKLKEVYYEDGKRCEKETIAYAIEEIYYPPVPVSIIYWLKNRKPKKWKDKPVDHSEKAPPVIVVNTLKGSEKIGGKK